MAVAHIGGAQEINRINNFVQQTVNETDILIGVEKIDYAMREFLSISSAAVVVVEVTC